MIREYPNISEQKNLEVPAKIIVVQSEDRTLLYLIVFTLALVGIIGITIALSLKK
jgi:hypothetical protein